MKWSLIIPIALIAGVVMSGCSAEEEEAGFTPRPGDAAVEGTEGAETAEAIGMEAWEPR